MKLIPATTKEKPVVEKVLLTVPETATSLGSGRTTIYELINDGELEVVKIGSATRITARSRDAFIERRASFKHKAA